MKYRKRLAGIAMGAGVLMLCAQAACKRAPEQQGLARTPGSQQWLERLSYPDPATRLSALEQLESLPVEQLKPLLPHLKEALAREDNPKVRALLQKLTKKVQASGSELP